MANRYLLAVLPAPGPTELTGDLAHHLARVLRVLPGERIRLGDGRGGSAEALIVTVDKRTVTVDVGETVRRDPTRPRITLAFACPRPARADWLIEHGTEIGVARFQPIVSRRSRAPAIRLDRWRKIAAAAVGQCDRDWAPEILEPVELHDWLTSDLPERRLLADASGEPLRSGDARDTALLVGPEGGFTDGEQQNARDRGFSAVRYGPHTLRTETAALLGAAGLLADSTLPQ